MFAIVNYHHISPDDEIRRSSHISVIAASAYGGLFLSALIAAMILPAQSEIVLVTLLLSGKWSVAGLLVSASIGNVLGSLINYTLGRFADAFRDRRWFPAKPEALRRARDWYGRYGHWSLLLSWVPDHRRSAHHRRGPAA